MNLPKAALVEKKTVVESQYEPHSVTPHFAESALAEPVSPERRATIFNIALPDEPLHRKGEWPTPRRSTSIAVDRHRRDGMRSSCYMVPSWLYAAR